MDWDGTAGGVPVPFAEDEDQWGPGASAGQGRTGGMRCDWPGADIFAWHSRGARPKVTVPGWHWAISI